MEEYSEKMLEVGKEVLAAMSMSLGLKNERELEERLGDEIDVGLRVNFYPPCPQPDLTLGLSSHSDPGALTPMINKSWGFKFELRSLLMSIPHKGKSKVIGLQYNHDQMLLL